MVLDAGDLPGAQRARAALRAAAVQRPRDRPVRRRRLRREDRGAAPRGSLAAELSRRARRPVSLVLSPPRGAARRRPSGGDAPDRPAGGRPRRHARRLRARRRDRDGRGAATWCRPSTGRRCSPTRRRTPTRCASPSSSTCGRSTPSAAPAMSRARPRYEQAIDELAAQLELDPLELRRRLHVDHDQGSGLPYSSKSLLACYDRAAALSGWADRERLRARRDDDGLLRGLGCATQMWFGVGGTGERVHDPHRRATGSRPSSPASRTSARARSPARRSWPPRSSASRSSSVRVVGGDTRPERVVRRPRPARSRPRA